MTFLDLFSGIGGFRRGMELAGHECVGFCEIDRFAVMSYTSMHLITDEQREYLAKLSPGLRRAEILKEEYRNGEWYASDIAGVDANDIPRADCWCFGFPCNDLSIAGHRAGLEGNRSNLFFAVTKNLRELGKDQQPTWLFIENVKNLLKINRGTDFLRVVAELDAVGYDAEWQVLNSKDFGVPQDRKRIYIVGHLRGRSTSQVFPLPRSVGENSVRQIGMYDNSRDNADAYRVYDPDGISPTLTTSAGGGRVPNISFVDLTLNNGIFTTENARAIQSRYYKGATVRSGEVSGVVQEVDQNETQIDHIWSDEYQCNLVMRRLTPRECFRLQGWTDDYFDKADFISSDARLYAGAGNCVTIPVIEEIAKRMKGEPDE